MSRLFRGMTASAAAPLGTAWISSRRDRYRRFAEVLPRASAHRLAPYFDSTLLSRARVARVSRIANPLAGLLGRVPGVLDLSTIRGMAFIDTIVVATANVRRGEDETSLLFHELVHLVQYHVLGTVGFVRAYVAGWLGAGRSYLANPLEEMAFELQDRFDESGSSPFGVEAAVGSFLNRRAD